MYSVYDNKHMFNLSSYEGSIFYTGLLWKNYKSDFLVIFNFSAYIENMLYSEKSLKISLLSPLILDQNQKFVKSLFYTLDRFESSHSSVPLNSGPLRKLFEIHKTLRLISCAHTVQPMNLAGRQHDQLIQSGQYKIIFSLSYTISNYRSVPIVQQAGPTGRHGPQSMYACLWLE